MRLLLANHIDSALLVQVDQRMFVHRMLWLANQGDVIVLPCAPDMAFVDHVARHLGFDPRSLRFIDLSSFCTDNRLFKDDALTLPAVQQAIRELAVEVREVFPLWPSPQVARMAQATGLSAKFPGCEFFAQAGDEFVNSKANFRRIAAGIGANVAPGAVCRTVPDAVHVAQQLLIQYRGIVVKQSQNHAGAGNLLITLHEDAARLEGGFKHRFSLLGRTDTLTALFEEKWAWATSNGTGPATIEAFVENAGTVYVEFIVQDRQISYAGSGTLGYEAGRLTSEAAPLRLASTGQLARLIDQGRRLAQAYQDLGYRGYLSADAVATPDGSDFVFTEVNARVGGSPHIYQGIADRVVGCMARPERVVTQRLFSPAWQITNTRSFLAVIERAGLGYDSVRRKGVLMSTPAIQGQGSTPPFFVCVVHEPTEDPMHMMDRLDSACAQARDHL